MVKVPCKKCQMPMSKYAIERETEEGIKTYKIKLCWKCGFFSIYPKIHDDFTDSILCNKGMILDLIEDNLLKPIL